MSQTAPPFRVVGLSKFKESYKYDPDEPLPEDTDAFVVKKLLEFFRDQDLEFKPEKHVNKDDSGCPLPNALLPNVARHVPNGRNVVAPKVVAPKARNFVAPKAKNVVAPNVAGPIVSKKLREKVPVPAIARKKAKPSSEGPGRVNTAIMQNDAIDLSVDVKVNSVRVVVCVDDTYRCV